MPTLWVLALFGIFYKFCFHVQTCRHMGGVCVYFLKSANKRHFRNVWVRGGGYLFQRSTTHWTVHTNMALHRSSIFILNHSESIILNYSMQRNKQCAQFILRSSELSACTRKYQPPHLTSLCGPHHQNFGGGKSGLCSTTHFPGCGGGGGRRHAAYVVHSLECRLRHCAHLIAFLPPPPNVPQTGRG